MHTISSAPSNDPEGGLDEAAKLMNRWEEKHTLGIFTFNPAEIHPCPAAETMPDGTIVDPLWVNRAIDENYTRSVVKLSKEQGIIPKANIMLVVNAPGMWDGGSSGPVAQRVPKEVDVREYIVALGPMPFSGGHTTEALKKQCAAHPHNKLWNTIPNIKVLAANLDDPEHVSMLRKLGRRANIGTQMAKKMDHIHIIRDVHRTLMSTDQFKDFASEEGEIYPLTDAFVRDVMTQYGISKKEDQDTKIGSFRAMTRMSKTFGEEWDSLEAIYECMQSKAKDGVVMSGTTFYEHIWNLPRKIRIDLLDNAANMHNGVPKSAELKIEADLVRSKAYIHNHILEVYRTQQMILGDPMFKDCKNFTELIEVVPALGNPDWISKLYLWARTNAKKAMIPERFGDEVASFMIQMSKSLAAEKLKVTALEKVCINAHYFYFVPKLMSHL